VADPDDVSVDSVAWALIRGYGEDATIAAYAPAEMSVLDAAIIAAGQAVEHYALDVSGWRAPVLQTRDICYAETQNREIAA
jgi:hypothetical protein